MTGAPYIATATQDFEYTDGNEAFEVRKGDVFTGLMEGGFFRFTVRLIVPGSEQRYPMDIVVPLTSKRFTLKPDNAHHTQSK